MSLVNVCGKIVNSEEPIFSAEARQLRYGGGFFETVKISNSKILHFHIHYSRVKKSLLLLGMNANDAWTQEYFVGLILELLKRNKYSNAIARIVFYREGDGRYLPDIDAKTGFVITMDRKEDSKYANPTVNNIGIYNELYKTSNFTSILKTSSANMYVLASIFSRNKGYGDCLLINEKGNIAEAISSNVFMVKGNKIITPPLSEYCVEGVMRNVVMQLASAYGYECQESIIEEQDLYLADELFLTNTVSGISSVSDFKGKMYTSAYADILGKMLNDSLSELE